MCLISVICGIQVFDIEMQFFGLQTITHLRSQTHIIGYIIGDISQGWSLKQVALNYAT